MRPTTGLIASMGLEINTVSALLAALGLAREHGGAGAALAAAGIDLTQAERLEAVSEEVGRLLGESATNESLAEALALGFLAGRVADRPPARARRCLHEPTAFVMDAELVVQAAEGESILRLPWFEDGLFVGRQLPDISEMPTPVRRLCIEHYTAALSGERGRFTFASYGHAYTVDALPVTGEHGGTVAVLAVATPGRSWDAAAGAYERTAERLERSAALAEQRAVRHRAAGRRDAADGAQRVALKARAAAERARMNARRLRERLGAPAEPLPLTAREAEVLGLASHGLTYAEIAEQLSVTAATVRTHLENIYPKLGVADKAAAVAAALRHGLIE